MTLGCGSWGGNVTSDNISPIHLMDIKRVAFETRPVKSARPSVTQQQTAQPARHAAPRAGDGPRIGREEIAAIVDRFLADRGDTNPAQAHAPLQASPSPANYQPVIDIEAGSMYDASQAAPQPTAAPTAETTNGGNGASSAQQNRPQARDERASKSTGAATNGKSRQLVDFVSEDDVRRAIQKGEKIYINARTIITPAARDMGEPAEVFAKG